MSHHHPWHDVKLPDDRTLWLPAVIEIPKGSKVKYELDKTTGLLRVGSDFGCAAVYYPENYGFIPRTYCDDGDPLDVLVLCQEAVVPLALLRARVIGMMSMHDEKGRDDKLIAVHIDDPHYEELRDIDELPVPRLRELEQFFRDYKMLEDKEVDVEGLSGPEQALKALEAAVALYQKQVAGKH